MNKNPEPVTKQPAPRLLPASRGWLADLATICNSELGKGIGTALVILAVCLGIGGCLYLDAAGRAKVQAQSK